MIAAPWPIGRPFWAPLPAAGARVTRRAQERGRAAHRGCVPALRCVADGIPSVCTPPHVPGEGKGYRAGALPTAQLRRMSDACAAPRNQRGQARPSAPPHRTGRGRVCVFWPPPRTEDAVMVWIPRVAGNTQHCAGASTVDCGEPCVRATRMAVLAARPPTRSSTQCGIASANRTAQEEPTTSRPDPHSTQLLLSGCEKLGRGAKKSASRRHSGQPPSPSPHTHTQTQTHMAGDGQVAPLGRAAEQATASTHCAATLRDARPGHPLRGLVQLFSPAYGPHCAQQRAPVATLNLARDRAVLPSPRSDGASQRRLQ